MFSGASTRARRTGKHVSISHDAACYFLLSSGEINVKASEAESKSWTNWRAQWRCHRTPQLQDSNPYL
jgi:hypothetical protein